MKKLYSPTQIALGAYLGGPLAAIYFLKVNFTTLGKNALAKKTLLIGILISILLLALMPFIPENSANSLIPLVYLIPVMIVVNKFQLLKKEIQESQEFDFQSNWKVLGMCVVWIIAFFVIAIGFMLILESVGFFGAS